MPSLTQGDLQTTRYQQHIQALDEHKSLLDQINESEANIHPEEITFSLEKLSITLTEYFKVMGIL